MRKSLKVGSVLFFIAFVLPIFGMMNCQGWNEGSLTSKSCLVGGALAKEYADFYNGLLFLVIPFFIYAGIAIFIIKIIMKAIDESGQKELTNADIYGKPLSLEELMKKDPISNEFKE